LVTLDPSQRRGLAGEFQHSGSRKIRRDNIDIYWLIGVSAIFSSRARQKSDAVKGKPVLV
jgi:hypothetical protein